MKVTDSSNEFGPSALSRCARHPGAAVPLAKSLVQVVSAHLEHHEGAKVMVRRQRLLRLGKKASARSSIPLLSGSCSSCKDATDSSWYSARLRSRGRLSICRPQRCAGRLSRPDRTAPCSSTYGRCLNNLQYRIAALPKFRLQNLQALTPEAAPSSHTRLNSGVDIGQADDEYATDGSSLPAFACTDRQAAQIKRLCLGIVVPILEQHAELMDNGRDFQVVSCRTSFP